jgi:hypothetical protein
MRDYYRLRINYFNNLIRRRHRRRRHMTAD